MIDLKNIISSFILKVEFRAVSLGDDKIFSLQKLHLIVKTSSIAYVKHRRI